MQLGLLCGVPETALPVRFTLTPSGSSCAMKACSTSETTSISDFSTNYCNVHNLYCDTADGCKPATKDIAVTESAVCASSGQSDSKACLV